MTELWQTLDRFLAGELVLAEFAAWVRVTPALVDTLGPADHGLLVHALRRADAARSARGAADVVAEVYERQRPGALPRDRASRLARGMLGGTINVAAGTRALARLRAEGHDWIPEAFAGLAAALDEPDPARRGPTASLAERLAEQRRRAAVNRAPALVAARRLLEGLQGR